MIFHIKNVAQLAALNHRVVEHIDDPLAQRVTRPRARTVDGSGELAIASYELFTSTEILGRLAMEKMLAGLSTRRYRLGLEPVGAAITDKSSATSKSAVSRGFVAMIETALSELLGADLSGLDVVALMIDGVKQPLALVEGLHGKRNLGHRTAGEPARARP